MTDIIINPSTGPCGRARLTNAWVAVRRFRRDLLDASLRPPRRELPPAVAARIRIDRARERDEWGRGYYGFRLWCSIGRRENKVDIDVPGIPLDRLRYLGDPDQNAWRFQRLYIDGSSWLWEFALGCAREQLNATAPVCSACGERHPRGSPIKGCVMR